MAIEVNCHLIIIFFNFSKKSRLSNGVRQALICFKRTLRFSKGYFDKISLTTHPKLKF